MTIHISAVVALQNPQTNESLDFSITTTRAIAITRENTHQQFSLKFFYDKRFVDNNTVNSFYTHDEILQITGNLTEISDGVIHINVHQAHSFGTISNTFNIPTHTIYINMNASIRTALADYPQAQRTSFEVVATQWVPIFPRPSNSDAPKGKNVQYQFNVHHPIGHSLLNKTKRFSPNQMANIVGSLEIFDKINFIQLADIDWISQTALQRTTQTPTGSPTLHSSHDAANPPSLSQTRALAADLAASRGNTSVITGDQPTTKTKTTKKRQRQESSIQSSTQHEEATELIGQHPPIQVPPENAQDTIEDTSDSKVQEDEKPSKRTRSRGKNILPSSSIMPKLTMIGGMPQEQTASDKPQQKRLTKLRDYAINLLPKRPFSYMPDQ